MMIEVRVLIPFTAGVLGVHGAGRYQSEKSMLYFVLPNYGLHAHCACVTGNTLPRPRSASHAERSLAVHTPPFTSVLPHSLYPSAPENQAAQRHPHHFIIHMHYIPINSPPSYNLNLTQKQ